MTGILGKLDRHGTTWQPQTSTTDGSALSLCEPNLTAAIEAHCHRHKFEAQRAELAQMLNDMLRDEILFETNRAFGTASTRQAYALDFRRFRDWCIDEELPFLPTSPEVLAHYLIEAADGSRLKRLERIVAAVTFVHQLRDAPFRPDDVLIRAALRWIRRKQDEEQENATEVAASAAKTADPPKPNGSGTPH